MKMATRFETEKVPLPPTTFIHDIINLSETGIAEAWQSNPAAVSCIAALWIAALALSVAVKRWSARPGGILYRFNKAAIQQIRIKQKRRMHAFVNDPVLARDLERSLQISNGGDAGAARAELDALRGSAKDWEREGFEDAKDTPFVKSRGWIVEWQMAWGFALVSVPVVFVPFSAVTIAWWTFLVVHIIDNIFIAKAMKSHGSPKASDACASFNFFKHTTPMVPKLEVGGLALDYGEPLLSSENKAHGGSGWF